MRKILVIEDNPDILENTAELLELSGYQVSTARSGKEGVATALASEPDLILCDILMPELDGYGVLHMVQKHPGLQHTPFIFLTALTEKREVRKGMSLGADDYITKPFDPAELLRAIDVRLKKADETRRLLSPATTNANDGGGNREGAFLQALVRDRHFDVYKRKQRIYNEGNRPLQLYYVQKGKVKIYKSNEEGKELILRIACEGEFFGYAALLENGLHKEHAEALDETEIVGVPKKEFDERLHASPEIARSFIGLLARDVAEKEEQLVRIAYNSLRRKVADALLAVYKKYKNTKGEGFINLSRENLAAVAGTATESLIRTLTDFKGEKLIDIVEGKILLLNQQKLDRLVN